jgi:hypothetical protein
MEKIDKVDFPQYTNLQLRNEKKKKKKEKSSWKKSLKNWKKKGTRCIVIITHFGRSQEKESKMLSVTTEMWNAIPKISKSSQKARLRELFSQIEKEFDLLWEENQECSPIH